MPAQLMFLVVFLALLHTSFAQIEPPKPPKTNLAVINDAFWLDQTKWPKTLQFGHLSYKLVIEIRSKTNDIVTSFSAAQATGKRYHAFYEINSSHLSKDSEHKLENWSQVYYGPHFEWLADGKIRSKIFHYENGFKEMHWFDQNGKVIWSDYFNHLSNRYWIFRYDTNGKTALCATGRDFPEQEFKGEQKYWIHGKEVNDEMEFIRQASAYRKDEIIGNQKAAKE